MRPAGGYSTRRREAHPRENGGHCLGGAYPTPSFRTLGSAIFFCSVPFSEIGSLFFLALSLSAANPARDSIRLYANRRSQKVQQRARGSFYFRELSPSEREAARRWLSRFIDRDRQRSNGMPVPGWRYAIFVGQAKRLALHPPTSDWGRRMRARKGGLAVQRKYRLQRRGPT